MALLEPKFAVLDETDSGLDIDALRIVSEGVNTWRVKKPVSGHYPLPAPAQHIKPDFVHMLYDGRIFESGKAELALKLEEQGYDWVREAFAARAHVNWLK